MLYSWGALELPDYLKRLAGVFVFFVALVGGPIAYQTFAPSDQPFEWALSAAVGSLVVVTVVVVRIFLGWSYVSDRLLSATYAYEETGWYDGQTFVKPPEVLTRDRLLGESGRACRRKASWLAAWPRSEWPNGRTLTGLRSP